MVGIVVAGKFPRPDAVVALDAAADLKVVGGNHDNQLPVREHTTQRNTSAHLLRVHRQGARDPWECAIRASPRPATPITKASVPCHG